MKDLSQAESATPSASQSAWTQLQYGMFIHFGPNTFSGQAWGDGVFPASGFAPAKLDCRQWARMAVDAGMKYAVLTAKHHDGFCLWPSEHTEYSVKNAGVREDVVGKFIAACAEYGLKAGFYYSLWDRNCPFYEDDGAYADYMRAQIGELLTGYGDILELWFDGAWDKDAPGRDWRRYPEFGSEAATGSRWQWKALYEHIHALQPNCLVVNNSSSSRPGKPLYLPVDIRTSEHFDFIYEERVCQAELSTDWRDRDGTVRFLPLEFCTSLNPDWFHIGRNHFLHPSAATIAAWRKTANLAGANLLLNVGPNGDGLVPEYHAAYLRAADRIVSG
ncbi:MAG: alpha-L-fucosidase [Capsulimonadaceae bacterium]|nr:alpha-L-fucosidase [Capsulimonadaceae bacterium]